MHSLPYGFAGDRLPTCFSCLHPLRPAPVIRQNVLSEHVPRKNTPTRQQKLAFVCWAREYEPTLPSNGMQGRDRISEQCNSGLLKMMCWLFDPRFFIHGNYSEQEPFSITSQWQNVKDAFLHNNWQFQKKNKKGKEQFIGYRLTSVAFRLWGKKRRGATLVYCTAIHFRVSLSPTQNSLLIGLIDSGDCSQNTSYGHLLLFFFFNYIGMLIKLINEGIKLIN